MLFRSIDSATLESNRKYNMAGEFYDEEGNSLYYKDQVDNYKQDHYQLHWNQNYLGGWTSNFGLHYTYGRGFYENYNVGYDTPDYIDRRWLDNDFYGFIFSVNQRTKNIILQLEVLIINISVNIMESIYGLIKIQILKTAIALRKNFTMTMEIRMSLIFSLKLTII